MFRVYDCIVEGHDLNLVALAVFVRASSSLVSFQVFGRARQSAGVTRIWLGVTMGFVAGLGTWATHFVAMLAFRPGLETAYEPTRTMASLVIAVVVMGCGSLIALLSDEKWVRTVGGGLVGIGIGAMHYTGMAAVLVPGRLTWSIDYVALSLGLGGMLAGCGFAIAGNGSRRHRLVWAALALTGAIASLHFTAMAAVGVQRDPSVIVPPNGISSNWLAVGVAMGTVLVLCIGVVGMVVDWRARRESARLREFADAAV